MDHVVPLLVAIPLAGGFLMPVLGRLTKSHRALAVLPIAMACGLTLIAVALLTRPDETVVYWMGGWKFPIGISLVADGLSKLVVLVIAVISLLTLLFSLEYMTHYTSPGLYYGLFLLMVAGMMGVVVSGDLFNIFVFLEIASIASYALVAYGTESDELEASLKYLVLSAIASTFILIGIAFVYNVTGHLNWAKIAEVIQTGGGLTMPLYVAAAFFLTGFGLKAAMVPFHAWLPDAHPSAPAPISAMLSGVLIKACGVYVLCRLTFSVLGSHQTFGTVLVVLGTLSMVLGALMAIGQADLKRLLAYSSISQVGYVVAAVGAGLVGLALANGSKPLEVASHLAVFGGLFHLMNHAVFKSLLFLCSGSIEQATGTRLMDDLSGLGKRMPVTGWALRVGALAISGVPPFGGFWSKLIIILALTQLAALAHWAFYIPAALAVVTAVITLVYYAKVQRSVLGGEPSDAAEGAREVPAAMCLASIVLAVLCLANALVVLPSVRSRLVDPAVRVLSAGVGSTVESATASADREVRTPAAAQVGANEGMTP